MPCSVGVHSVSYLTLSDPTYIFWLVVCHHLRGPMWPKLSQSDTLLWLTQVSDSRMKSSLELIYFSGGALTSFCHKPLLRPLLPSPLALLWLLSFSKPGHPVFSQVSKLQITFQWISTCASQFSSVQFSLSCVRLFLTPWTIARQASLSITNSWSLLKLMSIESVMSSNHLIVCCPLLLPPPIFPSIRVFSNESALHIRWPKY